MVFFYLDVFPKSIWHLKAGKREPLNSCGGKKAGLKFRIPALAAVGNGGRVFPTASWIPCVCFVLACFLLPTGMLCSLCKLNSCFISLGHCTFSINSRANYTRQWLGSVVIFNGFISQCPAVVSELQQQPLRRPLPVPQRAHTLRPNRVTPRLRTRRWRRAALRSQRMHARHRKRKRLRSSGGSGRCPGRRSAVVGMWWLLLLLAGLGRALPEGEAGVGLGGNGRWVRSLRRDRGWSLPPGAGVVTETGAGSSAPISGEAVRYRTAEMADAMLGSGPPGQPPVVLSAVPGEAKEGRAAAACEAAAGGEECGAGSGPAAPPAPPGEAVVLETVLPAGEEPNGTAESVKAPKVSCEERNVTGISNFTLQILNVSQVSSPRHRAAPSMLGVGSVGSVCAFVTSSAWLGGFLCVTGKAWARMLAASFWAGINGATAQYTSMCVSCALTVNCQP